MAKSRTGEPSRADTCSRSGGSPSPEDLAVWEQFPNAAFTLVKTAETDAGEEFRLGAFELLERSPLDDSPGEK